MNLFSQAALAANALLLVLIVASCGEQVSAQDRSPATPATVAETRDPAASLRNQYDFHARLFGNAVDGISDTEADRRISDNTNSLAWIAGHTLDIQYNLALLTGVATENPYAAQFAFGAAFDPAADYPSLETMKQDWDALSPKISAALANLTDEQLTAEAPFPLPYPEQNIRGLLEFQMHHLAFELGQLALYRKFLGKPAFSYAPLIPTQLLG